MSAVEPVESRDDRSVDDFHGHDTRRLSSDHLWVDVLATAGPRIVRLGVAGSTANVRDGTALVRRFEPRPGQPHPDLGCNVEVYVGDRYLELELLGPLRVLSRGVTVTLTEHWEIGRADMPAVGTDGRAIADRIDPDRAIADRIDPDRPGARATAQWLPV